MSAFGSTSHSTRNTASRPSCVARTMKWPRRSRASQARYCGLGTATVSASAFDMDFELLPQGVEIAVELRRVARGERRRARPVRGREADCMVRLHASGPARQDDHPLGHAHGIAAIVRDQARGFLLA